MAIDLKKLIPKRSKDAAFRVIDGQAIVVLPEKSEVKILNEVGSRIWQLMDGNVSVDDICTKICTEYEVSREAALSDVMNFIKQLGDQGMLEDTATLNIESDIWKTIN
ncbi:MAG: PqqD family protein [Acidobacteriota bacterium]